MIFWCRRWIEHSRSNRCTRVLVGVPDDLHLDMTGAGEVPLGEDGVVAERTGRLAAGRVDGLDQTPSAESTTLMPLPPPPALALMMSG